MSDGARVLQRPVGIACGCRYRRTTKSDLCLLVGQPQRQKTNVTALIRRDRNLHGTRRGKRQKMGLQPHAGIAKLTLSRLEVKGPALPGQEIAASTARFSRAHNLSSGTALREWFGHRPISYFARISTTSPSNEERQHCVPSATIAATREAGAIRNGWA